MTVSGKFNVITIAAVLASGAGVAAASGLWRIHHPERIEGPELTRAESKALTFLREHVQDWALFGAGAVLDHYVLDDDGDLVSFLVQQRHIYRYQSYRLGKVAALLTDVLGDGQQWTVTVDPLEGTASVERRVECSKAAA